MDKTVLDWLAFCQRDLRESKEGRSALKRLGIESAEVVEAFGLGYSSGRALKAMSSEQRQHLTGVGLIYRQREVLADCVVVPVYGEDGALVDLHGLRFYGGKNGVRTVNWQQPPRGMIGMAAIKSGGELILAENVYHALHVAQHGHLAVAALRNPAEIRTAAALLEKHGVVRVFLVTRQGHKTLVPPLERAGITVETITVPKATTIIPKSSLSVIDLAPPAPKVASVRMIGRTENRLVFQAGDVVYRIESTAMAGLGMKSRVKMERGERSFLDKLDLASASGRRKFAQLAGLRLGVSGRDVEGQLGAIADHIDEMECELAQAQSRAPKVLSATDEAEATKLLKDPKLLDVLAGALDGEIVGEAANKRLGILVAASRLLDKPLGAIVRGPAGSGKSQIIQAVSRLLPASETMNLSKLTAQALFYLPRQDLLHKLLIVDEYAGLEDSEYAIRTAMSSQSLSLAVTTRDGGRTPVTKVIEIPACLAILVSTTQPVNVENLSRLVELRTDDSAAQTARVMEGMAARSNRPAPNGSLAAIQNAMQMLKPVSVRVPFAKRLVYESASVLARRQFSQVLGLVAAHAALHQMQRQSPEAGVIVAEKRDYIGVHALLAHVVENFEESLSPAAMALLKVIQERKKDTLTRKEVMEWLNWPYSKAYRTLQELVGLDLLTPDRTTNGTLRNFQVAPYCLESGGIGRMPPPKSL